MALKKKTLTFLVLILVFFGFFFFISIKDNPSFAKFITYNKSRFFSKLNTSFTAKKKNRPDPKKTLKKISSIISEASLSSFNSLSLINKLENLGLKVTVAADENETTGALKMIRVQESFEGLRYFHAQFFSFSEGKDQLQHLSFDLKGSRDNLKEISESIMEQIPGTKRLTYSRLGYELYQLGEDYVIWFKLLTEKDFVKLKNDPFKVYKTSDIGKVIRVAIEEEIH